GLGLQLFQLCAQARLCLLRHPQPRPRPLQLRPHLLLPRPPLPHLPFQLRVPPLQLLH
ncbi:unnamed protein product, partial [Musa textilis]